MLSPCISLHVCSLRDGPPRGGVCLDIVCTCCEIGYETGRVVESRFRAVECEPTRFGPARARDLLILPLLESFSGRLRHSYRLRRCLPSRSFRSHNKLVLIRDSAVARLRLVGVVVYRSALLSIVIVPCLGAVLNF